MGRHLPANGLISSKPCIGLFGNGGIEIPWLPILSQQLWIFRWITILPTESILFTVLTLEVEYVHRESDILEDRVIFDDLCDGAVVVKKNVVGHGAREAVSPFYHFLGMS